MQPATLLVVVLSKKTDKTSVDSRDCVVEKILKAG
jgi:hypothetical protein